MHPVWQVHHVQVVRECVAVQQVAGREASAADGLLAELLGPGDLGAGVDADRGVVALGVAVGDDGAEVVGEALVERAGLPGVVEPRGGRGHPVGDFVPGDVRHDELGTAGRSAARVAEHHLWRVEVGAEEGVAVLLVVEIDRHHRGAAGTVPGRPLEQRGEGVDHHPGQGMSGDRVRIADRGAAAALDVRLAGQPDLGLLLVLRRERGDAAASGVGVVRRHGRVVEADALRRPDAVGGVARAVRSLAGNLDVVPVLRGGGEAVRRATVPLLGGDGRLRGQHLAVGRRRADVEELAGRRVDVVEAAGDADTPLGVPVGGRERHLPRQRAITVGNDDELGVTLHGTAGELAGGGACVVGRQLRLGVDGQAGEDAAADGVDQRAITRRAHREHELAVSDRHRPDHLPAPHGDQALRVGRRRMVDVDLDVAALDAEQTPAVRVQQGVDRAGDIVRHLGPRPRAREAAPGQLAEEAGDVVLPSHPARARDRPQLIDTGLQHLEVDRAGVVLGPVDLGEDQRGRALGGTRDRLRRIGRASGRERVPAPGSRPARTDASCGESPRRATCREPVFRCWRGLQEKSDDASVALLYFRQMLFSAIRTSRHLGEKRSR